MITELLLDRLKGVTHAYGIFFQGAMLMRPLWGLILFVATAQPTWGQSGDTTTNPATDPIGPVRTSTTIRYWEPREFMMKGGPLMWPILACSIVTITFSLERMISLRRGRVVPGRFVRRFLKGVASREIAAPAAIDQCVANGSPVARVFFAACRHWGRTAAEIETSVRDSGSREISLLRRNLRAINSSANLATLLGLLGTVFGMIDAFNSLATTPVGGARAEVLASGIAQALLTTAFGLVVAIPSIILYNYFIGRIDRLVYEIDMFASDLVEAIRGDAVEIQRPSSPWSALNPRSPDRQEKAVRQSTSPQV